MEMALLARLESRSAPGCRRRSTAELARPREELLVEEKRASTIGVRSGRMVRMIAMAVVTCFLLSCSCLRGRLGMIVPSLETST